MQRTQTRLSDTLPTRSSLLLPCIILFAFAGSFFVLDAVLPLYGLWFHTALIQPLGQWLLLPTHMLFPHWALTPTLFSPHNGTPPPAAMSWGETTLLLGAILLLFLVYLLALRTLPQRIGRRYLFFSTLLLGCTCLLVPVVTSQDIFSYIMYARIWVLYHLNPLIVTPMVVQHDPVYAHLYWNNQPSAYGPIWIIATGLLQWLSGVFFGTASVVPMVLALRLLGLGAHLGSASLIWSISGHLQHTQGNNHTRMLATFAFAWNPLLLFEACVNAHNDAVLLFLVLLAIWFLVRGTGVASFLLATLALALATSIKVNIALLFPGLLLFLWVWPHRLFALISGIVVYLGSIIVLYTLFWDRGAILSILHINPSTYRSVNTLPEFLSHLYNSIAQLLGSPPAQEAGSPAELFMRILSIFLFIIAYVAICWYAFRTRPSTPLSLVYWMALAWFLYCALGSPWFWPWYAVTFFGLFALLEAVPHDESVEHQDKRSLLAFNPRALVPAIRILTFSLLSLYCFYAWGPYGTFVPFLPNFRWAYLRSLWVWLLPIFVIVITRRNVIKPFRSLWRKGTMRNSRI